MPPSEVEDLDRVGDRRRVVLLEGFELVGGQQGRHRRRRKMAGIPAGRSIGMRRIFDQWTRRSYGSITATGSRAKIRRKASSRARIGRAASGKAAPDRRGVDVAVFERSDQGFEEPLSLGQDQQFGRRVARAGWPDPWRRRWRLRACRSRRPARACGPGGRCRRGPRRASPASRTASCDRRRPWRRTGDRCRPSTASSRLVRCR